MRTKLPTVKELRKYVNPYPLGIDPIWMIEKSLVELCDKTGKFTDHERDNFSRLCTVYKNRMGEQVTFGHIDLWRTNEKYQ